MYFKHDYRSTLPVNLTTLSTTTRITAKNDRFISDYWIGKDTEISDNNVLRNTLRYSEENKEQKLLSRRIFEPELSDLRSSVLPHQSTCLVTKLQWLTKVLETYNSTSLTQMSVRACSNWIYFTFTHHICCITCSHIVKTVDRFITCLLFPFCELLL